MTQPVLPRWEEMHYRLVSLWDLLMHRLNTNKLLDGFQVMAKTAQNLQRPISDPNLQYLSLPKESFEAIGANMRGLLEEAEEIGLDVVAANIKKALSVLKAGEETGQLPAVDVRNFHRLVEIAQTVVRDQLEGRVALVVPFSKAALYEQNEPPFGAEVQARFKTRGRDEISEASKCLALGRATASVFHLGRTVECGLDGIRACLQVPTPVKRGDKTWGAVLGTIETEIERRDDLAYVHQWNSMDDRRLFKQMHSSILAFKDAWRDPTMHLETTYNPEQAEHLFALTKGFMKIVASRLDEDGQPLA